MSMRAFTVVVLIGIVATVLAAGGARGGGAHALDPGLAARLATAGPDDQIQVIVTLRRQADLGNVQQSGGNHDVQVNEVVDELHRTAGEAQGPLLARLGVLRGLGLVTHVEPLWIFDGVLVTAKRDVIRELASRLDVLDVRLSRTLDAAHSLAAGPPEPNVAKVNAPALWSAGNRGEGVVVATLDTGVDVSHPDLSASWRGGANSWFDPYGQHATPADANGHGTWTTGAIVGGDAGGTSIGVAPGAKWIAAKIFNDAGTATTAAIHQAFQWVLNPDGNPATADAPNVVNGSWTMGAAGCDLEFQLDLRALRAAGILPVFAAGNSGPLAGTSYSPANNPEALAVGSTDLSDVVDPGSSRGPSACDGRPYPDVVAPGVGIRTTDLYGGYTTQSGTSMAAPSVSGALALLLSRFPDAPVDRQATALETTAVDVAAPGVDNDSGYGRIDAQAAYAWLAAQPDFSVSTAAATASTPVGGTASYTVDVGSRNGFAGDVALSVSGLSAAQATSTLAPATITGGSGSSRLTVATASSLAPGTYKLTVAGASGTLAHRLALTLNVTAPPDFSVAASPSSASALAGGTVAYTVNVGSLFGFTGNVALSLSGLSASQGTATFSPASVASSGTSTLSVTSAASLSPGSYPLTITGTSGSTTHTTSVTLVVLSAPDFTVSATPAAVTVTAGQTAVYTVRVSVAGGFTGTVTFSLTGLPAAASATWTPASVSAPGSSTLRVTTKTYTTKGTFTLKVSGKSGTLVRQTTTTLTVK